MPESKARSLKHEFLAAVDRIEDKTAVLEVKGLSGSISLPLKILPAALKEKDILRVTIILDQKETKKRLKETASLIEELKNQ